MDAKFAQGAVAVSREPNGALQRIIGQAGHAQHRVAGTQYAKQRHRERVGAAHKVVPHQRILRAECVGIDFIECLTAAIAIAIAGGSGKVALAHTGLAESGHHLLLVVIRRFIDPGQNGGNALHRAVSRLADRFINVKSGVKHHKSVVLLPV